MSGRLIKTAAGVALLFCAFTAGAVEERGKGEVIEEAKAKLAGGSTSEKLEAAATLEGQDMRDISTFGVVEFLAKTIKSESNPRVLQPVARALGNIGRKAEGSMKSDISKILFNDVMRSGDVHALVRAEAIVALQELADFKGYEGGEIKKLALRLATDANTPGILKNACFSLLAAIGDTTIASELEKQILSEDDKIRIPAIRNLRVLVISKGYKIPPTTVTRVVKEVENERAKEKLRIDLLQLLATAIRMGTRVTGMSELIEKLIKRGASDGVRLVAVELSLIHI